MTPLKALRFPIWVGWLCGVLVLKRPWGNPSLPSWFTFSTGHCLFGLIMYLFILTDFAVNGGGGLTSEEDEERQFAQYVEGFALLQYAFITFFKRIAFLRHAKRLAALLEILGQYEIARGKERRKQGKCARQHRKMTYLVYCSFLLAFVSIIARSGEFMAKNVKRPSWIKQMGLGNSGYFTLYSLFAVLPLGIVSNVAYAVIMVVSLHVTQIFCEFCCTLKDSLATLIPTEGFPRDRKDLEIYNILKMGPKREWQRKKLSGASSVASFHQQNNKVVPTTNESSVDSSFRGFSSRQEVVERFEQVKELLGLTGDTLASLVLWMISGMTLGMVANASQFFVTGYRSKGFDLAADILIFPLLLIYGLLLELGHRIGRMQKIAKLELQKRYMHIAWSVEKDEMDEVLQEIFQWEWKLSACEFFYVDRRLASGIFSLTMNYVVILVQLNIALTETPACANNQTLAPQPFNH